MKIRSLIYVRLNVSMRVWYSALIQFSQADGAVCQKRHAQGQIYVQMITHMHHCFSNTWHVLTRMLVKTRLWSQNTMEKFWKDLWTSMNINSLKMISALTSYIVHGKWPNGIKCISKSIILKMPKFTLQKEKDTFGLTIWIKWYKMMMYLILN